MKLIFSILFTISIVSLASAQTTTVPTTSTSTTISPNFGAVTDVATCGLVATPLLPANRARGHVRIRNIGGTNPVYICANSTGTACTTSTGSKLLPATTTFVDFIELFNYKGLISCITTGSSTTVEVLSEY